MSALPHGSTVEWRTETVKNPVDFSLGMAVVAVDCSSLDSTSTDNRPGLKNPACSVTASVKDGIPITTISEGDISTLTVSIPIEGAVSEIFSATMMCDSITAGGTVNGHQTVVYNFVSSQGTALT